MRTDATARDVVYLEDESSEGATGFIRQMGFQPRRQPTGDSPQLSLIATQHDGREIWISSAVSTDLGGASRSKEPETDLEDEKRSATNAILAAYNAEIDNLSRTLDGNDYSDAREALIKQRDEAVAAVKSRNSVSGIQEAKIAAIQAAPANVKSALEAGLLNQSSQIAQFYGESAKQWNDSFKREAAAFERDVERKGFAQTFRDQQLNYDHIGPAHAYLLKHSPEYRKTIDRVESRTQDLNRESKKDMDTLGGIAKKHGIEGSDAYKEAQANEDRIQKELADARSKGEINRITALEAEVSAARAAKAAVVEQGLKDKDPAAASEARRVKEAEEARFKEKMKLREEAYNQLEEELRKKGVDPVALSEMRKKHTSETQRLTQATSKSLKTTLDVKDDALLYTGFHDTAIKAAAVLDLSPAAMAEATKAAKPLVAQSEIKGEATPTQPTEKFAVAEAGSETKVASPVPDKSPQPAEVEVLG